MTNRIRIRLADQALNASDPDPTPLDAQTRLTDLLANLQHWARDRCIDFSAAALEAGFHFEAERGLALDDEDPGLTQ